MDKYSSLILLETKKSFITFGIGGKVRQLLFSFTEEQHSKLLYLLPGIIFVGKAGS